MKRLALGWRSLWGYASSPRLMSAVGLFAAVIATVCINILVQRFHVRWDVTSAKLYSLSPVTLDTLRALDEPTQVIVLLGDSDPSTPSVRQILASYGSHSAWLQPRFIDPDRNPTQFAAEQRKYDLAPRTDSDAHPASDTSIVIAKGKNHWRIAAEEFLTYDQEEGRVTPRLEQALTSGIRNVIKREVRQACFTTGHGEASIDSAGAEGLSAFRASLERNNFQARELAFGPLARTQSLEGCTVLILAAARVAPSPTLLSTLADYVARGGAVLVMLPATLSAEDETGAAGLETVLRPLGIEPGRDLVLEQEAELTLPTGIAGEAFLATPKSHEITRALAEGGEVRHRVLMRMARSFNASATSIAFPLLVSSQRARSIREPARLANPDLQRSEIEAGSVGERVLAVAAELAGGPATPKPRWVVLGSIAPFTDTSLRGGFYGSQLFVDGVMGWLVGEPPLVNIPEKPAHAATLNLTEESLSEVSRYVLLYLPGAALLIGLIVLHRRRSTEDASRAGTRS